MRLRENEVAYLRLVMDNESGDTVRACVSTDNQWRIHPDDLPEDVIGIWQDILQSMVAIEASTQVGYMPVPRLRHAYAALSLYPGSQLVTWRGKAAYERQMRADAELPDHQRKMY